MKHENRWTTAILLASGLALSACAETSEAAPATEEAAIVQPLAGNRDLSKVTLIGQAAERLGIKTVPVRQGTGSSGAKTVIPYGAVIYDPSGGTWTYTEVAPLTYVRDEIVVDRILGSRAILTDGPAVGTAVVSIGAVELYGAEVGVDH
jgi:hypothetical protein